MHRDEDDPILLLENERVDEYEELPENSVKYVRHSSKDWIFHVFGFVSSKTIRAEASTEGNDGTCELLMNDGQTRVGG